MDVRLAERSIAEWAAAGAHDLGLKPNQIQASFLYHPGGFGNISIRLTDSRTSFHVKLAPPDKAWRLQQWANVSDYLTEHYTAPRLVYVIDQEIVPG